MPQAIIHVFQGEPSPKAKSTISVPFMYDTDEQLEKQLIYYLADERTYKVTAVNTCGEVVKAVYRSIKRRGKIQ